ncbi:hypothetical protein-transmembrane prediction [Rhodopirellula baltica SH 1]|uniref:Uncharacterized protein n=1 Tax=Rhodopirellula baltica (strain DSM 10527 / NCIMB 13988 / SH1) TaxID=243090 RepID=Q7UHR7_RHOBA|nr:hypothetical protein-transmembrane prediction [Rhodopirellula baltica SH 1]
MIADDWRPLLGTVGSIEGDSGHRRWRIRDCSIFSGRLSNGLRCGIEFHSNGVRAVGLVGISQVAGVIISVASRDRLAMIVIGCGNVFRHHNLYDDHFIFARWKGFIPVLIAQRERSIARNSSGIPSTRLKRAEFDAAGLNRITVGVLDDSRSGLLARAPC